MKIESMSGFWYIRAAAGSGDVGVEADASYHRERLAQRIGL
jgi:hypothetical protein